MAVSQSGQDAPGADLQAAEQRLSAARGRGDRLELAEALATHANALVRRGQLARARDEVNEVVDIYRQLHDSQNEARYAVLAATLSRLVHALPEARAFAQRAAALAPPGSVISVSSAAELGEIALAAGDHAAAADAFGRAVADADAAAAPPKTRIELLRKRGTALAAIGRYTDAVHDLGLARELALDEGEHRLALLLQVEQVTALQQSGDQRTADEARHHALGAATSAEDHFALAQLYLLEATRAIEQRDAAAGRAAMEAARSHALEATAPIPYMSAAIALSDLADATGDRLAAYESLAKVWVTLSDLLGAEPARLAIEPKLQTLREKWGPEAFAATKAAYDARRRAEL